MNSDGPIVSRRNLRRDFLAARGIKAYVEDESRDAGHCCDEHSHDAPIVSGGDALLPRLRMDLDFQPSPSEEQPGLLIRDSFRFSDTTLIIPPYLLRFLPFFDGQHTRQHLVKEIRRSASADTAVKLELHLRETLESAGFLESEKFHSIRNETLARFKASPVRKAAHAGMAYPFTPEEIRYYLDSNLRKHLPRRDLDQDHVVGVAAPHISFEGGWKSYAAAIPVLQHASPDSLFVVMGTSHYGPLDKFGLTTKAFETPLGTTRPEDELVRELATTSPDAVIDEDYCHAIDHSLEFHVLLLQHFVRPDVRVIPVLVGAFAEAMGSETLPEQCEALAAVFAALRDIAARHGRELFWLLSVDMAHMGRRYGDDFEACAYRQKMAEIEELDRSRIRLLERGEKHPFWQDVAKRDAEIKWCGSSTLYSFSQVYPEAKGQLLSYEQWNIDPTSVVSFGTLAFHLG